MIVAGFGADGVGGHVPDGFGGGVIFGFGVVSPMLWACSGVAARGRSCSRRVITFKSERRLAANHCARLV